MSRKDFTCFVFSCFLAVTLSQTPAFIFAVRSEGSRLGTFPCRREDEKKLTVTDVTE